MAPEMDNVIGGEIVDSEWGNDIRDRTIQRYANVAERTADHPTPTDGDLSFLNDTGKVYVFDAGTWHTFYEGHGSTHASSDSLGGAIAGYIEMGRGMDGALDTSQPSSFTNAASVTFTKPGSWSTYTLMCWGNVVFRSYQEASLPQAEVRAVIGSNTGSSFAIVLHDDSSDEAGFFSETVPVSHIATGLSATHAVAVQFRQVDAIVHKRAATIQYIAIRTT